LFFKLNLSGEVEKNTRFDKSENLSCALGCFDGVHEGHKALLAKAVSKTELCPAVWTFSKPLSYPYIDSIPERLSACGGHGIRLARCEDFNSVKELTPKAFVSRLVNDFNVRHFVCGSDFRFGINRSGDASVLKREAELLGASVDIIPPVLHENEKISSTLIRSLISDGEICKANQLLGRPFSITGAVVSGNHIGTKLGFPTVNQSIGEGRLVPEKLGVYNTATLIDGVRYPSVTNVGKRPTVNGDGVTVETHIIDESFELYGKEVTVEFYGFSRGEVKFDSLWELKRAIESDIKTAKESFFENPLGSPFIHPTSSKRTLTSTPALTFSLRRA
jgi:riboflavin kinase/FMN adenylyltransferase